MTADNPTDHKPPYVWKGTIQLGALPRNPSTVQADEVMRIVSEHYGQQWYAVKLSGWWRIICKEAGVGWGADEGQRTRDFARALTEATGMPVVRDIPWDSQD